MTTRKLALALLALFLTSLAFVLTHPPDEPPAIAGAGRGLPSVEEAVRLAGAGEKAEAVRLLAGMTRRHPSLADRKGPIERSPVLRDLILSGGKKALSQAVDRRAFLRDLRFLQRRLAGGCS